MNDFYIFTEIVNCGKIGNIAIDSFHKYHNYKVHIYGTKEDFKWINKNVNNIFIEVELNVIEGYRSGHLGTAILWEQIIKNCNSKYLIHFDSDTIFRDNIIDEMMERSNEYDIIGPIRNYHHNQNNRNDIAFLTDLCQTNCTLFNLDMISTKFTGKKKLNSSIKNQVFDLSLRQIVKYLKNTIKYNKSSIFIQMIRGTYSPFCFGNIDFFDPVMFDMIKNGAKVYHLDFNDVGGCDKYGSRENQFKNINNFPTEYKLDFGKKLVHFSCVGSGMNFYNNNEISKKISKSYVKTALDRYALFCKIFFNEIIPEIDLEKYDEITNLNKWY